MEEKNKREVATFAAGCFWGVEDAFRKVPGVIDVTVGYTGGTKEDPTYEQVCDGGTGHAEAVQIEFDPKIVSFGKLLDKFWSIHNPTTKDRQGPDVGRQYRSAIFFHSEEQEKQAQGSKLKEDASGRFGRPIVTEIVPAGKFFRAEEYHQRYFEKTGASSCHI